MQTAFTGGQWPRTTLAMPGSCFEHLLTQWTREVKRKISSCNLARKDAEYPRSISPPLGVEQQDAIPLHFGGRHVQSEADPAGTCICLKLTLQDASCCLLVRIFACLSRACRGQPHHQSYGLRNQPSYRSRDRNEQATSSIRPCHWMQPASSFRLPRPTAVQHTSSSPQVTLQKSLRACGVWRCCQVPF